MEIHIAKVWVLSPDHSTHLGLLFDRLRRRNFVLAAFKSGFCNERDAASGCDEAMARVGLCRVGQMCNNVLFVHPRLLVKADAAAQL